ncbi:hypothetical protein KSP40_PGU005536 [Platanthera guangdongensis]|uniref:Uncharacterized protein n=1 Tax=Platanthera guangdongensis TaxID=2320717 RepID=A0ABR2M5B2_9ASPA
MGSRKGREGLEDVAEAVVRMPSFLPSMSAAQAVSKLHLVRRIHAGGGSKRRLQDGKTNGQPDVCSVCSRSKEKSPASPLFPASPPSRQSETPLSTHREQTPPPRQMKPK